MENISRLIPDISFDDKYDCGDDTVMYISHNSSEDEFELCRRRLESAGFVPVGSSCIDSNVSADYRRDFLIHIYFTPVDKTLRAVEDHFSGEYLTEIKKSGKFQSSLWQFEIDHSLIDCGMCYIMRCDDGSFFVIDSAHWYSVNDDIRIIEFLRKISGEQKPRVSGWFFSHAHEDHIGKFNDILAYHYDEIEIGAVYYNFPPAHPQGCSWEMNVQSGMRKFNDLLGRHPQIRRVKLHTGMRFAVGNILFTVLCTHEDVYPAPFEDFNNTSCVIKAECEGTVILFPGDASFYSDKVMISRYPGALRCDVIQVSHHGHSGTSPEFYRRAGAKCALFPVTQIKYDEEFPRQESNRLAVEIADEYHIASNGTVEVPLPYKPGETKLYPDETFENFEGIFNLWTYEYTPERMEQLRAEYIKRSNNNC